MKRLTIGADACTETLALMITMAWADGRLDDVEKESVLEAAQVFNLTKELRDRVDQILQKPMPVEEQAVVLYSGVRGYLDNVDIKRIGDFEREMLSELKAREPSILDTIRADLDIKKETEEKLKGFLEAFAKSFAA